MQITHSRNRLISSTELLKIWPVTQMTLWRHLKTGDIPKPLYVGKRRYWRREDIELWLANEKFQPEGL